MKYAILDTDWTTPRYIEEGLRWLAGNASVTADRGAEVAVTTVGEKENADV